MRAFILILGVLLAGCARQDPKLVRIEGDAPGAVAVWRAGIEAQIPPAQWHEIDDALQELRWSVKTPGTPANSPAIAEALGKKVAGAAFNDVLRLGYQAKVLRLEGIRVELKDAVNQNGLIAAKDSTSATYLDRYRSEQQQRLIALDRELQGARRRLIELDAKPGAAIPEPPALPDATPAVLARTEALREINDLIERRRMAVQMQYGNWPIKFDLQGSQLPAADQPEFQRRGAAAAANDHAVVGVLLKGTWRIYDAPLTMPAFPPAVTGNLTPADLAELKRKWALLEAEIWSRDVDRKESGEKAAAESR